MLYYCVVTVMGVTVFRLNFLYVRLTHEEVFLPPANRSHGKVMFLHLSVSHSVHMGGRGSP